MNNLSTCWNKLWFKDNDGLQIEIIRFSIGCLLLINYVGITPDIIDFYSNNGWISLASISGNVNFSWVFSIHYWLSEPWHYFGFHGVFLLACLFFTVGYKTKWIKWLVLIGHLSYINRNPAIIYGVDNILASLVLLLCLAPIGSNFSVDALKIKYRKKLNNLNAALSFTISPWGFACTRMIQLQMATLFFFSAVDKLKGDTWWSGDALWIALNNFEFTNVPIMWLAEHYWIANLMNYSTLVIEIAFTFLIWGKPTRPYFLSAALLLHAGIAVLMGLYLFAAVMAVGHFAFIRTEWILNALSYWKKKVGHFNVFYDGDCGFCRRSMAWLLTFDGLNQIRAIDFRTQKTTIVDNEKLEKSIYLINHNGDQFPGFSAYKHLALRMPGLWWIAPLFNVPYLSQKIGPVVYQKVADNRYAI